MIIRNTAEIARLDGGPQLPYLATTASFENGNMRVYTHTVAEPASAWRTPPLTTDFVSGTVGAFREGSVGLVYLPDDAQAAGATAWLLDTYLDTTFVPHDIQGLPLWENWNGIGLKLRPGLPTVPISIGVEGNLSAYTPVSTVEFVGSALWTIFRTLRTTFANPDLRVDTFQVGSHEPIRWSRR